MKTRTLIVSLVAISVVMAGSITYHNTIGSTGDAPRGNSGKELSSEGSSHDPANSTATEESEPQSRTEKDQPTIKNVSFSSVDELDEFYETRDVAKLSRHGTQYIVVKQFPDDFKDIYSVKRKKRLFRQVILPIVRLENKRLRDRRNQLVELIDKFRDGKTTEAENRRLRTLRRKYDVVDEDRHEYELTEDQLTTLRKRIDVIPTSLALAQAANESAWGTSRFCLEANNIFGEWTYDKSEGLKPNGVDESAPHRVKIFPNIRASIRSYMHNLNTHQAYKSFRTLRANHADTKNPHKLVKGLEKYSSERQDYLDAISNLIRYNDYRQYDQF